MPQDLVTTMLPILGRSVEPRFNVFDVMHHGTHEKQISNVFGWLLDTEGTHGLKERFVKIFVDAVAGTPPFHGGLPRDSYWVRQEVNTALPGEPADIADLVLASDETTIVIENYFTSDGHQHSYEGYLAFAKREQKRGVVVLLCRDVDRSRLVKRWDEAHVVTYRALIEAIWKDVAGDAAYQAAHPEAFAFIGHMYQKFVKGSGLMDDHDVLGFVTAFCAAGEAERYSRRDQGRQAELFADELASQVRERYGEGRELLQRLKNRLRAFAAGSLRDQLTGTLGAGAIRDVDAGYQGIYQWSINMDVVDALGLAEGADREQATRVQLKFGPSAWFALEKDPAWERVAREAEPDYDHLYLTLFRETTIAIRRSAVTLRDVLDGLQSDDRTLHDEIIALLPVTA